MTDDGRRAEIEFSIRPIERRDRPWVAETLTAGWGGCEIVTRGRVHQAADLPGFIATVGETRQGLVTYRPAGEAYEVISLDSLREGRGIGAALLGAVEAEARRAGAGRVWLITTNDNLHAIRFYQRRGYRLVAVHAGALEASRRLKPTIPETGLDGIPLRDEIELEKVLGDGAQSR